MRFLSACISLSLLTQAAHAQGLLDTLQPTDRPGATMPILLEEDMPVVTMPTPQNPQPMREDLPGVPMFEWADENPVPTITTPDPEAGLGFVPAPPPPTITPPTPEPAPALPDAAPFAFEDIGEDISTPDTQPFQAPTVTQNGAPTGPTLTLLPGTQVHAYTGRGTNTILLPENSGGHTLVLSSNQGDRWAISAQRNSRIDGILLVGPGADYATLEVRTYTQERSPVIRRGDLPQQAAGQALTGLSNPLAFRPSP